MLAARRTSARAAVLEVNAPVIDYPGSSKRLLDRCLLVEPMRRWRDWQCRRGGPAGDAQRGDTARLARPRQRILEVEWGADTDRFQARRASRPGDRDGARRDDRRLRRAPSGPGTARSTWSRRSPSLRRRGSESITAVFAGDGPERPRVEAAARERGGRTASRGGGARSDAGGARACDIGVAPFDIGRARPAVARVLLVAAQGVRVHGGRPPGGGARDRSTRPRIVGHGREGLLYDAARPGALADALAELTDPDRRRALGWAAARERGGAATSAGRVHCAALDAAIRGSARRGRHERLGATMRILIATDSFPPDCGGSGWSTYELARGLRARGHSLVDRPAARRGAARHARATTGSRSGEIGAPAPSVPYVRNYFKNERLTARLAALLAEIVRPSTSTSFTRSTCSPRPASVAAARQAGIPSVCTVRDYWPVCYWSDLIHDRGRRLALPRLHAGHDDALRPAARRRRLAAGAADDPVHAREPGAQAARARRRRRGRRRQHDDRRRPAGARARACRHAGRGHSEPGRRRGDPRARPARGRAPQRRALRALRREARAEQGRREARAGRRSVRACRGRWWWSATGPIATSIETAARRTGRDVRLLGWLPARGDARLDGSRVAAGLPVARPGVVEPRAARVGGARRCRLPPWTPAARATSSSTARRGCSTATSADALGDAVARLVADRALAATAGGAARERTSTAAFGAAGRGLAHRAAVRRRDRVHGGAAAARPSWRPGVTPPRIAVRRARGRGPARPWRARAPRRLTWSATSTPRGAEVTLVTRPPQRRSGRPAGAPDGGPRRNPAGAAIRTTDAGARGPVPDLPVRRPPRHHGARPEHGLPAVRAASRVRRAAARARGRDRLGVRARRQRARLRRRAATRPRRAPRSSSTRRGSRSSAAPTAGFGGLAAEAASATCRCRLPSALRRAADRVIATDRVLVADGRAPPRRHRAAVWPCCPERDRPRRRATRWPDQPTAEPCAARTGIDLAEPLLLSVGQDRAEQGLPRAGVRARASLAGHVVALGARGRRARIGRALERAIERRPNRRSSHPDGPRRPIATSTPGTRRPRCSCIRRSTRAARSSRWKRWLTAVPVVATDAGGLPDKVAPGTTGGWCRPVTRRRWRSRWPRRWEARRLPAMGRAGRELAEREFAWPVVADRFLAIGAALIGRSMRPSSGAPLFSLAPFDRLRYTVRLIPIDWCAPRRGQGPPIGRCRVADT